MIKFYRGLSTKYDVTTHGQGIYFATDTLEIIHNEKSYSGLLSESTDVKDVTLVDGVMTITFNDNSTKTIEVGSGKYSSNIEDKNVAMTTAYGDYKVGTKVSALEGKTYDEILDGMLFPTINPTKTDASVSGFALDPNTSPVELGTAVASISEAGLNRGKWNSYNNNAPYVGEKSGVVYTFTINGETYDAIDDLADLTYTTLGNQTYKAVVSYNAGEAPKNNKGVAVESLAAAAGSKSAERSVNVTAPWYASTVTSGVLTKQALISWDTTAGAMQAGSDAEGFEVQPHTAAAPQMFKVPRKASSLKMYSTVSKTFETVALSAWAEVSATEQVNGVDHTYYTYTYKGENRGAVKLIVKF